MITAGELAFMQNVASARWREDGPYVEQHIGDLAWGVNPPVGQERLKAHLFEDAYAFADGDIWHLGGEDFDEAADAARDAGVTVYALEAETAKTKALAARGFTPADDTWLWHFARDLDDLPPVPPVVVTDMRTTTREERVRAHREAWEPSMFTLETYDAVAATPPYRPDLDVVVRDAEGETAAYVLAWYDGRSASGELEPVGTRLAYRRRGYGAAACLAALHRLRDAGARTAVVYAVSDPGNPGPRALYESVGFTAVDRHLRWLPPSRQNAGIA